MSRRRRCLLLAGSETACSAGASTLLSLWSRRLRHAAADRKVRCSVSTWRVVGVSSSRNVVVVETLTRRAGRSSWTEVVVVFLRRGQSSSATALLCSTPWSAGLKPHLSTCIRSLAGDPCCSVDLACCWWVGSGTADRSGVKLLAEHRAVAALWQQQGQFFDGVITTVWRGTTVIDVATCTQCWQPLLNEHFI